MLRYTTSHTLSQQWSKINLSYSPKQTASLLTYQLLNSSTSSTPSIHRAISRTFSTTSTIMSKHSEACCTIPPVMAEGYQPKGKYHTFNGHKTYVTGPEDATSAIFYIYDIFGFREQSIQGADILANADKEKSYQVFIPDFFEGNPCDIAIYPPDTDEKKAKLGKWFETAAPPKHLPKIAGLLDEMEKANSNIKNWGVIGYCWGGKMVSLVGQKQTKFKVGVQTSPAMVDPADAEKIQIPMAVLASKDEPADDIKKYEENLKVDKHVETFGDQLHGWMSARADLKDPKVKAEYERGYEIAVSWFHKYL